MTTKRFSPTLGPRTACESCIGPTEGDDDHRGADSTYRFRPTGTARRRRCPRCSRLAELRSWGTMERLRCACGYTRLSSANTDPQSAGGYAARGVPRSNSKLTPDLVREIRADDRPVADVAATYGISLSTVSGVRNRQLWRWVP